MQTGQFISKVIEGQSPDSSLMTHIIETAGRQAEGCLMTITDIVYQTCC